MPKQCNHNTIIKDYTGRVFQSRCYHCNKIIEPKDEKEKKLKEPLFKFMDYLSRKKQIRRCI